VTAFANEVRKHPMLLSQLEVLNLDGYKFRSAQATSKKHGKNSVIAQVSQLFT